MLLSSASIYRFLLPVQPKQLVALKEPVDSIGDSIGITFWLVRRKMITPLLPNSWLPALSKEAMDSGAAHLAQSTKQCRR